MHRSISTLPRPALPAHQHHNTTPANSLTSSTQMPLDSSAVLSPPPTAASPELDSQLSALGHVGLVKHFRDGLRQDLVHEKLSSSGYRKLSFRLAAHVAARDARLSRQERVLAEARKAQYLRERRDGSVIGELMDSVKSYEQQGLSLWGRLKGWGEGGEVTDDGYAQQLDQHHGPAMLPSPPYSRSPSHQAVEKLAQHLPDEILALCQARVDALLRECRLSRDTLALLRETEGSLKREVLEYEQKLESLLERKGQSDQKLNDTQKELDQVLSDLSGSRERTQALLKEKEASQQSISDHKAKISNLESSQSELNRNLDLTRSALSTLEENFKGAQVKVDLLEKSKAAMEEVVKSHEAREVDGQSQSNAVREQLAKLQDEHQNAIDALQRAQNVLAEEKQRFEDQAHSAGAIEDEYKSRLDSLQKELHNATESCEGAEKALSGEKTRLEDLQFTVETLNQTIASNEKHIQELEHSQADWQRQLEGAKSLQNDFSQSANKLSLELEGEKARTSLLIERESELKGQIEEYDEIVQRLNIRVETLEDELLSSKADAKTSHDLENELKETTALLAQVRSAHEERVTAIMQSEANLRAILATVRAELQSSQTLVTELRRQRSLQDVEINSLRKTKSSLEERLASERATSSATQTTLNAELDAARATLSSHESTIASLLKEDEERNKSNDHLRACLAEVSDEKARVDGIVLTLQEKVRAKEALTKEAQDSLSSLREKLNSANGMRRSINGKLQVADEALETLRRAAEQSEGEMKQLKMEVERLTMQQRDEDDEKRELKLQISRLEKDLKVEKSQRQETVRKEKTWEQEKTTLKEEITRIQGILDQRIEDMQSREQELQRAMEQERTLHQEHNRIQEALDQKIKDMQSRERELENTSELGKATLQQEIARIQSMLDQKVKDNLSREQELKMTLEQEKVAFQLEVSRLQEALNQKSIDMRNRERELERSSEQEKAKFQQELTGIQVALDHKILDIQKKDSRITELLKRSEAESSELNQEVNHWQAQYQAKDELAMAKSKRLESLELQISANEQTIFELTSQLETHAARTETLVQETRTLRRTHGQTVARLTDVESRLEAKDLALNQFHTHFRTLQKNASETGKRVRNMEADLLSREQEIKRLKDENEELRNTVRQVNGATANISRPRTSQGLLTKRRGTETHVQPLAATEQSSPRSPTLPPSSPVQEEAHSSQDSAHRPSPTSSHSRKSTFSEAHTRVNSSSSNMIAFFKDIARPKTPIGFHLSSHKAPDTIEEDLLSSPIKEKITNSAEKRQAAEKRQGRLRRRLGHFGLGHAAFGRP